MKELTEPGSPERLHEALIAIFPELQSRMLLDREDGPPSFHAILIQFFGCFVAERATDRQLRGLGDLINVSVIKQGPLENAFGTCLLEHLGQIGALKKLRPYLSKTARQLTHA